MNITGNNAWIGAGGGQPVTTARPNSGERFEKAKIETIPPPGPEPGGNAEKANAKEATSNEPIAQEKKQDLSQEAKTQHSTIIPMTANSAHIAAFAAPMVMAPLPAPVATDAPPIASAKVEAFTNQPPLAEQNDLPVVGEPLADQLLQKLPSKVDPLGLPSKEIQNPAAKEEIGSLAVGGPKVDPLRDTEDLAIKADPDRDLEGLEGFAGSNDSEVFVVPDPDRDIEGLTFKADPSHDTEGLTFGVEDRDDVGIIPKDDPTHDTEGLGIRPDPSRDTEGLTLKFDPTHDTEGLSVKPDPDRDVEGLEDSIPHDDPASDVFVEDPTHDFFVTDAGNDTPPDPVSDEFTPDPAFDQGSSGRPDGRTGMSAEVGKPEFRTTSAKVDAQGDTEIRGARLERMVSQVVDRIEMLAGARPKNGVTILLEPRELGAISMNIRSTGNQVEAQIQATDAGVRAALMQNRNLLDQSMQARGLSLGSMSVGDHSAHQRQEGTLQHAPRHSANGERTLDLPDSTATRGLRRSGRDVDLWI